MKDEKHECSLGTLTLPLSRLLEAEDMTLNQRFALKNSGPSCTLKMKMALRVGGQPAHDVFSAVRSVCRGRLKWFSSLSIKACRNVLKSQIWKVASLV